MTYAKQLQEYEDAVIQKRFEELQVRCASDGPDESWRRVVMVAAQRGCWWWFGGAGRTRVNGAELIQLLLASVRSWREGGVVSWRRVGPMQCRETRAVRGAWPNHRSRSLLTSPCADCVAAPSSLLVVAMM